MTFLIDFFFRFFDTCLAILPVVLLIIFFQFVVIKKTLRDAPKVILGFVMVVFGLTFFLLGLEKALFPVGEIMAKQLSNKEFIISSNFSDEIKWYSYYWIYLFAALIGFSTTIAEPSLTAVAIKANEVSGGLLNMWQLRITVAVGAGFALALGAFRIVTGVPLYTIIIVSYVIVLIQTIFVKKDFVGLAYDSGGVTTSTVTVPIVVSIGLGLSSVVEGRDPVLDGFGMIALVCMFPIISVLAYIQFMELIVLLKKKRK